MITCIPCPHPDLPSKMFRVAEGRELCVGKHFSRSYQHSTGHAGSTLQEQEISKTHSKKYTNMLSFYKSQGFPEKACKYITLLLPILSAFPEKRRMASRSLCPPGEKLRRNSCFLNRNFLLNTVSKIRSYH